jgi:hypothetical protein
MRAPRNREEGMEAFGKLSDQVLEGIMTQLRSLIREGEVIKVNNNSRLIDVKVFGTEEVIKSVKYSRGITNVSVGDTCLLINADPKAKSRARVVGIY